MLKRSDKLKFFVVGGDLRQLQCAEELKNKGYETVLYGFSKDNSKDPVYHIKTADYILLPLPITYDKLNINAPLCEKKIPLSLIYDNIGENAVVFGGMIGEDIRKCLKVREIYDYAKDEEFLVKNAVITAEGAFDIIFSETKISVFKSKFLVCGYGRIGKIMAKIAKSFGADVTVAARKSSDFAWIEANGFKPLKYKNLNNEISGFDIIVNTVPYRIFDKETVFKISQDAFFIDLASLPGGCDSEDMKEAGIKWIHALSLPGKTAPCSSGKIISETILNIMDKD